MKKLFILLLLPFAAAAQTDSLSYTTDTVAAFERTTLISEFDKAYGRNKKATSALRFKYLSFGYVGNEPLQLEFEQKLSPDFSILLGGSLNYSPKYIAGTPAGRFQPEIVGELRYYYDMNKRISQGLNPNFTGNYVSLFANYYPGKGNLRILAYPRLLNGYSDLFFQILADAYSDLRSTRSLVGISWGKQLGKSLNIGVKAGWHTGDNYRFEDVQLKEITRFHTPYITTFSSMSFGIEWPFQKKKGNQSCDFQQCNTNVYSLWKLNLNEMFYADKFAQNLNLSLDREWKIARSAFSFNASLQTGINRMQVREVIGTRPADKLVDGIGLGRYKQFSDKQETVSTVMLKVAPQLRYYFGQKVSYAKGKSGNNLNGYYVGMNMVFERKGFIAETKNTSIGYLMPNNRYPHFQLGRQLQNSQHTFIDWAFDFNLLDKKQSTNTNTIAALKVGFTLKLGLAK